MLVILESVMHHREGYAFNHLFVIIIKFRTKTADNRK